MRDYEKRAIRAISIGISCAIGLTACGGSTPNNKKTISQAANNSGEGPAIKYVYHQNGTREIITSVDGFDSEGASVNVVLEYCDGGDLVEQIENNTPIGGWNGGDIERTPNYAACSDGRLTPNDFK